MSYRLLKQLAHGLALLVLQRWSIWLLLVGVGVVQGKEAVVAQVATVQVLVAKTRVAVQVLNLRWQ